MRKINIHQIVNLSPLVDVFMIVIFWYIMVSNQTIQENKTEADRQLQNIEVEYTQQIKSLEEEIEELKKNQEKLQELIARETEYLYISVGGTTAGNRAVEVQNPSGEKEKILFSDSDREALSDNLKAVIQRYTGEEKKLVILFVYKGNNTLYKDKKLIQGILDELKEKEMIVIQEVNLLKKFSASII